MPPAPQVLEVEGRENGSQLGFYDSFTGLCFKTADTQDLHVTPV